MPFIVELENEYKVVLNIVYKNNKIIVDVEKIDPLKLNKYTTEEGRHEAKNALVCRYSIKLSEDT